MTDRLLGIDVSHHQPDIQWNGVADSGIAFCYCRATYGISEDRMFSDHFQKAQRAGLVTGAYHFLRFNARMNAEAQAQAFLETLSDAGALNDAMLPPVLDMEDNRKYDEIVDTAEERRAYTALALKWLDIVEAELDRTAIIYSTRSFFEQLDNPPGFAIRPLWVAHYTSHPSPRLPGAWSRYTFWQFTENGSVSGIPGGVDLNRFEGDITALKDLTRIDTVPEVTIDEDAESEFSEMGTQGKIRHIVPKALNIRSEPEVAAHTLITSLPLAHPVEVLESGVAGGWSRVRTVLGDREIHGFVSERYLRDPLSQSREKLIAEAVKQWLRFRRGEGKETQAPYYAYIGEMWQALNMNYDGRNTRMPWSAAFISFIARNAGAAYEKFKFSARHSTYIHDAIIRKEQGVEAPFWGHRLGEYRPELGDMVVQWRKFAYTYEKARENNKFPSHVDIVVRLTDEHVVTLGGNVSNSVSMKERVYELDHNGFLKTTNRTFAVLENRTA